MSKTVVGLFSSMTEAEQIRQSLLSEGFSSNDIKVVANESDNSTDLIDSNENNGATQEGIGQKISNFFHGLTGGDEDVHQHYATGINNGGAILAVICNDQEATRTRALLKQYGASEIETGSGSANSFENERVSASTPTSGISATSGASGIGSGASANAISTSASGETAIPIVEEELVVGKREVDRGGVRIYSHVVEQPVSADVTLRDESILVERRPVSRVATAADFNMGQGSVIELNATGEEAVIGKNARVVEELVIGKTSSQHTEVVQDSVRRTEVEVEQIPGVTTTAQKDRY